MANEWGGDGCKNGGGDSGAEKERKREMGQKKRHLNLAHLDTKNFFFWKERAKTRSSEKLRTFSL